MTKYESITCVLVPMLMAIIMGYVGKRLIAAQVELPSSCIAGMIAVCTAMVLGAMTVVTVLLVKIVANQKK